MKRAKELRLFQVVVAGLPSPDGKPRTIAGVTFFAARASFATAIGVDPLDVRLEPRREFS